jgi:PKD repeat protein
VKEINIRNWVLVILITSLLFLTFIPILPSEQQPLPIQSNDENIVHISFTTDQELSTIISSNLDIIDKDTSSIIAYATKDQQELLKKMGIDSTVIYKNIYEMMGFDDHPERFYDFHDYYSLTTELQLIADTYPTITNLTSLGDSVQGRSIWGLKISNNQDLEEIEPEVRICGAHHGNELMSVELPLLFAWHLVQNYTVIPEVTDLIDNTEIWIIPLVNPDGRQMMQRRNANNVDLNRDYGYLWDGSGGSPQPFSQPETQAIRTHAIENNFVVSLSYHTTAAYVNFVWNYKPQPAPDDTFIQMICNQYAQSSGYTAIRGYDWYQTRGDTNDFSYGCKADIDTTIETENSNIAYTWNKNRDAMMDYILSAHIGLSGIVKDVVTEQPIEASIWVEEANWPCYNDPLVGDYHKPLLEGTYTVHVRANGYEPQNQSITILDANASNFLNFTLIPGNHFYAYQVTMCNFYDPYSYPNNFQNNPTEGISALGPPDNNSASIGEGGMIMVDMGSIAEIIDNPGDDFIIYEADDSNDGYHVSVSQTWNGSFILLGTAYGTTSFDLSDVGLSSARYVKIIDDNDGSPYEQNPGFDLDAVEALNLSSFNEPPTANFTYFPTTPTTEDIIQFTDLSVDTDGSIVSWLWNFGDGNISTIQHPMHQYQNPGVYFVTLKVIDNGGKNDNISKMITIINNGPNANFKFTPTNPLPDDLVQFTDLSFDSSGDSIVSWAWDFGDGNTSTLQHPTNTYTLNGSYLVNLTVMNTSGTSDTILKTISIGLLDVDISLDVGWNLITVPIENEWYASDLADNITGSLSVSRWDSVNQTYKTFIVGGPPVFDFPIEDGSGYFVDTSSTDILSLRGSPIDNVSIPLEIGWNLLGWYHEYNTTASSLSANITGSLSVSRWDSVNQTYNTFIVGGPPVFDFNIHCGVGLFVDVNQQSIWHGG